MEVIKDINEGITFLRIEEGGKEKLILLDVTGYIIVPTRIAKPIIREVPKEIKEGING